MTNANPNLPAPSQADQLAPEPERQHRRMVKRFIAAAAGIVLISAAATAVLALNEVNGLVAALGQSKAVKLSGSVLAPSSSGSPQTLLLVGDDRRPPPKSNPNGFVVPHSNEMLLVRIDPGKPTISMLSIPRELRVTIRPPGAPPVTNRINVAYTIGGIQLMTETIKRVLGVAVNHVFVVTFPKFKRAVNEMGCVYMTVDRRYYHRNEPGGEQYFEINLQPGYQRLCGQQALEFVANRHEDTSLTRDARDQRFLLEAKGQYGPTLFENREKFERIFGRAVETDLHGAGQVLDLLRLLVAAQGKPVRQIPFKVNLLASYDTATPQQISASVRSFLNGTAPIVKQKISHLAPRVHHYRHKGTALPLTPTPATALAKARSVSPELPFPVEYPTVRDSYPGARPDSLRVYPIHDPQGRPHPSYVAVINRGGLGEFYDVQGTSWTDVPLLSNPNQTVHVGSRDYALFYAGEQVRLIAWREGNANYWIQNTLTNSVSPRAMLAMAERTQPVIGAAPGSGGQIPSNVALPARVGTGAGELAKLAALLGFPGLLVVALMALMLVTRQRELQSLRQQVAQAMALEARQRPALAAAGLLGSERPDSASAHRQAERPPARRRARLAAAFAAALVSGLLIALALSLTSSNRSTSRSGGGAQVAVAVFNGSGTPGVAHRVAVLLRASHVRIARVGDINASLGHGTFVLYPAGAQAQAQRLAVLLRDRSPVVNPIQPQVQATVGQRNQIVVVID